MATKTSKRALYLPVLAQLIEADGAILHWQVGYVPQTFRRGPQIDPVVETLFKAAHAAGVIGFDPDTDLYFHKGATKIDGGYTMFGPAAKRRVGQYFPVEYRGAISRLLEQEQLP